MSLTYIGRRKCAVALVRFVKGNGDFIINGKTGFNYLQDDPFAIQTVVAPLKLINLEKKYNIVCSVRGGGICAQAEAIQLGIARALCSLTVPSVNHISLAERKQQATSTINQAAATSNETANRESYLLTEGQRTGTISENENKNGHQGTARPLLKQQGYLRRDSRIKERRKYGLKKARKAEQYSKR